MAKHASSGKAARDSASLLLTCILSVLTFSVKNTGVITLLACCIYICCVAVRMICLGAAGCSSESGEAQWTAGEGGGTRPGLGWCCSAGNQAWQSVQASSCAQPCTTPLCIQTILLTQITRPP